MGTVDLDEDTHAHVRLAARLFGVSESEVVRRAIMEFTKEPEPDPPPDPWQPVELYGEYDGRRVFAQYLPATGRVTVTSEPLAGHTFTTPSAAARAVIAALNPARAATQTNGWRFFRLVANRQRLEVLRQ